MKTETQSEKRPEWMKNLNKKELLGKGTYGSVFRYTNPVTDRSVAIKKIKMLENEGIPSTALREMSIISQCDHPNLVKLLNYNISNESILLAYEYFPYDLKNFLESFGSNKNYDQEIIRTISYQILRGLYYMHCNLFLHRDIKPSNILINPETFVIKLADFGLARSFYFPIRPYTKEIATLYYRPPEIILGSSEYSTGVDVWAAGCILAELFVKRPIFKGECDFTQLINIFKVLGTPTPNTFEHCTKLRNYSDKFPYYIYEENKLENYLNEINKTNNKISKLAIDLLKKMLVVDPSNRISIKEEYFDEVKIPYEIRYNKDEIEELDDTD